MENINLFNHITEIAKEYKDPRGFISQESYHPENDPYIFQNPYLFSGQYLLALYFLTGIDDFNFRASFNQFHKENIILPGLFSRFPNGYIYTTNYDAISLDEHNGLIFSGHGDIKDVYNYGNNNWWTFDEIRPNKNFLKEIIKNPKSIFSILTSFKAMYKIAKNTGDWDGSKELDQEIFKNRLLVLLSRKRLPKDIFLIKVRYFPEKITIIEKIHFYLSIFDTIKKPKKSGVNMLLYKFIYLEVIGYSNFFIKKLRRLFLQKVDVISFQNQFYKENKLFKILALCNYNKLLNIDSGSFND